MVENLFRIKEMIEENGICFHFNLEIDSDGEILFKYNITQGFKTIESDAKLFNACDKNVNIKSFKKLTTKIENDYKNYMF